MIRLSDQDVALRPLVVLVGPTAVGKSEIGVMVARALGTVFVRSTRVGNGRVTGRSEFDRLGIIPADNLSPQKARILLMLALTRTSAPDELRRIFSEY